ncbi:MAG: tetratricopeptide repeat protein, partial [Myxococcota bacterium]
MSPRFFLLFAFAACARTPAPPPVVHSGAVVHTEEDPLVGLEHYDARTLFHLAGEAERNGDVDRGIALYDRLLENFPSDVVADAARFNAGLLHERKKDFAAAIPYYEDIYQSSLPPTVDGQRTWLDAHYRAAVCLGKLERWWAAVALFERVEALDWLEDDDRLEALVGRGISLQEAGDPDAAELVFSTALRFHRLVSRRRRFDDRGLAAEAAFRLGDISRERFLAVILEYPVDTLRARLDEKCQALLSAQNRYLQAVRVGDTHTVAAAGFRIGSLYERLYEQLMGLEVPPELDAEEADVYLEEVHSRIGVLVEKAIKIYEKSLIAGRRIDSAASWVEQTEAALARLKSIYLARA